MTNSKLSPKKPELSKTDHEPKRIGDEEARIAVIGAGAFGTALAASALAGGNQVTLIGRDEEALKIARQDPTLKGCKLFDQTSFQEDLTSYHLVLLAIPSQALRSISGWINTTSAKPRQNPLYLISAAKGIEQGTLKLPHEIIEECLEGKIVFGELSGPSFAKELRDGLPTSVVVASSNEELRRRAEYLLHRSFFRVYSSTDVVGVEVGGAVKNVIALVAGAVDGLGLGSNARAAVITRGLGEMTQIGVALGADTMTFLGLSGIGDLVLTCSGDLSRNRQFGMRLARGESKDAIISSMGQVIEGVATAQSAWQLSSKLGLDTPIIHAAYRVLYEGISLKEAVAMLLGRRSKTEFHWIQR